MKVFPGFMFNDNVCYNAFLISFGIVKGVILKRLEVVGPGTWSRLMSLLILPSSDVRVRDPLLSLNN